MKRTSINWIAVAIAALVLVNIGLVATIWLGRQGSADSTAARPGDRNPLATQLGFDSAQRLRLDTLRDRHFAQMKPLREQMRGLREAYFGGISRGAQPSDSLAAAMAGVQQQIDRALYAHFAQVRTLCTDAQKKDFDRMLVRIVNAASRGPRPGNRPGGGEGRPDGPPPGDGPEGPMRDGPHGDGDRPDGPPMDGPGGDGPRDRPGGQ